MKFFGYSDIGKRRATNQDKFLIRCFDGVNVIAVFDGMGGAKGGEEASGIVCETFESSVARSIELELEEGGQITRTFAEKMLCEISDNRDMAPSAAWIREMILEDR